ncbi:unnamed protein product [Victoria cruziana]
MRSFPVPCSSSSRTNQRRSLVSTGISTICVTIRTVPSPDTTFHTDSFPGDHDQPLPLNVYPVAVSAMLPRRKFGGANA